jgi:hypothetical protein
MFNKSLIAFAAAATISTVAATVHADTVALTVIDTGSTVAPMTYSSSAASGYVLASSNGTQSLGNFQYNISDMANLGATAQSLPTAVLSYTASTISNTGNTTDTLELILSATGFSQSGSGAYNAVQFNHSDGGTFEGGSFSMSFQTFADSANTLFTTAPAVGASTAGTTISTGAWSSTSPTITNYSLSAASAGNLVTSGSPYSLTSVLRVTLAPDQSLSLTNNGQSFISATNVSLSSTPEPSVLPMFAAGLLGLGLLGRKKYRPGFDQKC